MKNLILVISIIFALIGCNKGIEVKNSKNLSVANELVTSTIIKSNLNQSEAYNLFKNTCYACHSVTSKTHIEIIAPPMVAVKRRYLMTYPKKEDFVSAMVAFANNPTEEKALMFGAVQQFSVMTNLNNNEEDLKKIANFIYDNAIEKPEWFDAHFKEEHRGEMGKGRQ